MLALVYFRYRQPVHVAKSFYILIGITNKVGGENKVTPFALCNNYLIYKTARLALTCTWLRLEKELQLELA